MRLFIVAVALSLALGLAACGGSTTTTVTSIATAPPSTPTVTTPPPRAATAVPVYFQGVAGAGKQRPSSLQLTADGTLFVSGVQWTSWGGTTATGSGTAEYHGCIPNCAQATPHEALVSIRLAVPRVCSGRRYYSSVTLTTNSGRRLDASFLQRSWSPC